MWAVGRSSRCLATETTWVSTRGCPWSLIIGASWPASRWCSSGTSAASRSLCAARRSRRALSLRVGVETAGRYHRTVVRRLVSAGHEVVELNPGHVEAVCSAQGFRTLKSDLRDAVAGSSTDVQHGRYLRHRGPVRTESDEGTNAALGYNWARRCRGSSALLVRAGSGVLRRRLAGQSAVLGRADRGGSSGCRCGPAAGCRQADMSRGLASAARRSGPRDRRGAGARRPFRATAVRPGQADDGAPACHGGRCRRWRCTVCSRAAARHDPWPRIAGRVLRGLPASGRLLLDGVRQPVTGTARSSG